MCVAIYLICKGLEINAITKEAWNTANDTEDKREKIQALSLVKECYSMRLDLLTNATVVDDAIRFVSSKSIENPRSSGYNNEQAKECDYEEDKEETGEVTSTITTNQVF